MNQEQTISWIFLATAMASNAKPASFAAISSVADGINHAVPSHKELQASISWLIGKGLIERSGKDYRVTAQGELLHKSASANAKGLLEVWEIIEAEISSD